MPKSNRPTISTHVLDTTRGQPAAGVAVTVWRVQHKQEIAQGTRETDKDGRIADAMDGLLAAGTYRISFDVGGYYKKNGDEPPFMQRFTLEFEIIDARRSYHIPLLMSPYSCASYRGS
jgi:5-hydroxyisourate hydrolase